MRISFHLKAFHFCLPAAFCFLLCLLTPAAPCPSPPAMPLASSPGIMKCTNLLKSWISVSMSSFSGTHIRAAAAVAAVVACWRVCVFVVCVCVCVCNCVCACVCEIPNEFVARVLRELLGKYCYPAADKELFPLSKLGQRKIESRRAKPSLSCMWQAADAKKSQITGESAESLNSTYSHS